MGPRAVLIAALLLGCTPTEPAQGPTPAPPARPVNVPAAAAVVDRRDGELRVDEDVAGDAAALFDVHDEPHPGVVGALRGRTDGAWIALEPSVSWQPVRRIVKSALHAGAGPLWIGGDGAEPAIGPIDNAATGRAILACPAPLPVTGLSQRLAFEVQRHGDARWVTASLRFLPRVAIDDEQVVAELLPESCWGSAGCDLLDDARARGTCEAALAAGSVADGGDRVLLGSSDGCLVPPAGTTNAWRERLPAALAALGLSDQTHTLVLADDDAPLGDVLQLLRGLREHGVHSPQLGLLNMGSGEDTPDCGASVRTREHVEQARGRWLAAVLQRRAAHALEAR